MTDTQISPRERGERRGHLLAAVREFFTDSGFLEVDTPVALTSPAPEIHIEAPMTELSYLNHQRRRFLQTSPELPMKRVLASGLPRIYQLTSAFRNHDYSDIHRPEFRILEWYRRDTSWQTLMVDCENLLKHCVSALGQRCGLELRPARYITVDEAFRRYADFSILDALEWQALYDETERLGCNPNHDDDWGDLFHRIFLAKVEPCLLKDPAPLFLTHYPAPLACLARLDPDDTRVAERFELYLGGMELANGFGELTDPIEQRKRFRDESAKRERLGLRRYPIDERFLSELSHLDSAAGIALGFDRLALTLFAGRDLDEVTTLPWSQT